MLLRSIVVVGFALVVPACSPCAFGFCSDAGEGEGEGEGAGEGEGEGNGQPPSSPCQTDVECQIADAGSGRLCSSSSSCARNEVCAASTGNTDICVAVFTASDPPCEALSSVQLSTFTAFSVEGQQFEFCASPNVFCNDGACSGGVFSP